MPLLRTLVRSLLLVVVVIRIVSAPSARAQETGTISGRVLNATNGQPAAGATISVVGQADARATTDGNGGFTVVVAPGTHTIRVRAEGFGPSQIGAVVVAPGGTTRADASLTPEVDSPEVDAGVEVMEVLGNVLNASEVTQQLKRQSAASLANNLSAEFIAKTPDSDAGEVVTRIPAVTIRDDKFVVIRGLNERYNNALLDGSRLPSTDPNKRIVPLDLFPTDFIDSISVVKSYTPDLPGDFAGGLVAIDLTQPPQELTYGIGLSMGANTETTFQDVDTYPGCGVSDSFGFGTWCRDLPSQFPDSGILGAETTPQVRYLVDSLPLNWELNSVTAPPAYGIDANIGGAIGPLSLQLAGNYGTSWQFRNNEIVRSRTSVAAGPTDVNDFTYDRSTFETNLGGLLSSQYTISKKHKLNLRGLVNHQSSDEVLNGEGTTPSDQGKLQRTTSAIYTEDQLSFGQLTGAHSFSLVNVDWRASLAESRENQPDGKFLIYERDDDDFSDPYSLFFKAPSTQRFFVTLDELLQDYYLDLTFPFRIGMPFRSDFSNSHFKSGLAYSYRDRDFALRTFQTIFAAGSSDLDLSQKPNKLLDPSNYGATGPLRFLESLQSADFQASHDIAGVYGMFDVPVVPDFARLIFGYRVEYSYIRSTADVISVAGSDLNIVNDLDPLPAVSLIVTPTETMSVRAAFSQTVSRPEFRELNPAQYPTEPGSRTFLGNPALVSADITNYDLRWEWFPSAAEMLSVGFFYKDLERPFENIVVLEASNLNDYVVNAEQATLWGFEFELRKNFAFLAPYARRWRYSKPLARYIGDLEFSTNASYVQSEATGIIPPAQVPAEVTNENRALSGQAPFVVNAALQWEHYRWGTFRVLYNTAGRTIDAAGANGIDDIYVERRDQVDFVWIGEVAPFGTPLKLKLAAENITNDDYLETQKPIVNSRYFNGVSFSLGISYEY